MENNIFEIILNSLPQGIIVLNNKEKKIVFLNKRAQKILKIQDPLNLTYPSLKKILKKIKYQKKKQGDYQFLIIQEEKDYFRASAMLVSLCSHQLRSPLTNIKWTLRMILDEEFGHLNPEQKEFLTRTLESTDKAILLVNHLVNIDVLRGEKNLKTILLEDFINELKNCLKDFTNQLNQKRMKIFFFSPKKPKGVLRIDLEKIKTVFKNLVDNAIKYSFENSKIVIQINKRKKEILVKVKDEGIGIPKEEQKSIFSPFFRSKNAIQRSTKGIGLGLYLSRKIIQEHKGKLDFKSKEGKGSLFYFTLPLK